MTRFFDRAFDAMLVLCNLVFVLIVLVCTALTAYAAVIGFGKWGEAVFLTAGLWFCAWLSVYLTGKSPRVRFEELAA